MINNTLYFLDIPENNNNAFIDLIKANLEEQKVFPYDCCDDLFKNQHENYLNLEKYDLFHGKFGIGFKKNFEKLKIITTIDNPLNRSERFLNNIFAGKYKDYNIEYDKNDDYYDFIFYNKHLFSNIQTKFLGLEINPLKLNFEVLRLRNHKFLFEIWPKFNISCTDTIYSCAMKNLNNLFFIGLTEDFNCFIYSFFKMMNLKFNWDFDVFLEKLEVYKKFHQEEEQERIILNKKCKNLLIDLNEYDLNLYDFAKKTFNKKFKNIKFFL